VSEDSVLLAPPRFLALPRPRTKVAIECTDPHGAQLTFLSPVFQHRLAFDLTGIAHRASDNYFELFAGEPRTVRVDLARPQTAARLRRALRYHSLADAC
jgi:beta-mannosidase